MSKQHQTLIEKFYTSFAKGDAAGMAECYHPEAEFSDPAFKNLKGNQPSLMWKMLIERSKGNLQINFKNIKVDSQKGSADWEADYEFSKTKRKVHNEIHAEFEFKDGLIYRHKDSFDFGKWASQALGLVGWLLGGTSWLQNKVSTEAMTALEKYQSKQ